MGITNKQIEDLLPGQTIWDESLKGFGVIKRTDKGSVSFFLKTRFRGKQLKLTIGRYGNPWTPKTARDRAMGLLTMIASGHDPREIKPKMTIKDISLLYLAQHVFQNLKPKTQVDYKHIIKNKIILKFGKATFDDLSRSDVAGWHNSYRETPRGANFALAVLSSMWSWSIDRGFITAVNNCLNVKRFKENKRDRYLSEEEAKRLGKVLDRLENKDPYLVGAIRLFYFTGARRSEILSAKWEWIKDNTLMLPDSKTGFKIIPLSEDAQDALKKIPKQLDNPYIICGGKPKTHLVEISRSWRRIAKEAELKDFRLHDLRHNFASAAVNQGMSLALIGGMLGHKSVQTTNRYAHLYSSSLKAVANKTSTSLSKAMQGHGK